MMAKDKKVPVQSISKRPIYVDVTSTPPPDAPDVIYVMNGKVVSGAVPASGGSGSNNDNQGGGGDDSSFDAPTNLHIVSQKVHQGQGKTQSVDVVIGFDDVDGATSYNARVSKV